MIYKKYKLFDIMLNHILHFDEAEMSLISQKERFIKQASIVEINENYIHSFLKW